MNGTVEMNNNNNQAISITKEEIAKLDLTIFQGRIILVQTVSEAEQAVAYLNTQPLIGFDTETRPAFRKGQTNKVALLQLSSNEYCFLFRLNLMGFPPCLIELLNNDAITKIGLSLKDDFAAMRRMAHFEPAGFVELQSFVKRFNIQDASLQKIYAILFGQKISKNQRLTNWEADILTDGQKKYAATDAWACLRIFEALTNKTDY